MNSLSLTEKRDCPSKRTREEVKKKENFVFFIPDKTILNEDGYQIYLDNIRIVSPQLTLLNTYSLLFTRTRDAAKHVRARIAPRYLSNIPRLEASQDVPWRIFFPAICPSSPRPSDIIFHIPTPRISAEGWHSPTPDVDNVLRWLNRRTSRRFLPRLSTLPSSSFFSRSVFLYPPFFPFIFPLSLSFSRYFILSFQSIA